MAGLRMHGGETDGARRLTLMLLIDAFRSDYVKRAPFIRSLSSCGASGSLREPFGFVPRAAYFGGLSPDDYGFTNMYCLDPDRSPFGLARAMPKAPSPSAEAACGIRREVDAFARRSSAPFAKSYVSSLQVPLEVAPFFDTVEKRAPWDRHAGYRSLFHLLDDAALPWYQCSWPSTNELEDPSDAGIVERALRELDGSHRFAYIHLQELDGVGHVYGPGSRELDRALRETDARVAHLVSRLEARYDVVDLLLFGDHGMVPVVKTVDLWRELRKADLRFGTDYAYFLDSSMARFWFYTDTARRRVTGLLSRIHEGSILDEADKRRFSMSRCDPRNGELFFLVEPGTLIFPNFYQADGDPISGMHGYSPDCPDNQGYFLLVVPDDDALPGRVLGEVDARQLFPTLVELLDLDHLPLAAPPVPSGMERPAHRRRETKRTGPGSFTTHPDPRAQRVVATHVEHIVSRILDVAGDADAVVLVGSFGRGEGAVTVERGRFLPVNDYDLLVVGPADRSEALRRLGNALASELGCDFVDIGWSDGRWESLPPTIFNFDLKYGSRVLHGEPSVIERIPRFVPEDIPLVEGVQLLLNRVAGLLTGLSPTFFEDGRFDSGPRRYLTRQIAKAWVATGDWHLLRHGAYDESYRTRGTRFASLRCALGVSPETAARVARGYRFKLAPDYRHFPATPRQLGILWSTLGPLLTDAIGAMVEARPSSRLEALSWYEDYLGADAAAVEADDARLRRDSRLAPLLRDDAHRGSLRTAVYASLPFILDAGLTGSETSFRRAEAFLGRACRLGPGGSTPGERFERLRARAVFLWEALTHGSFGDNP